MLHLHTATLDRVRPGDLLSRVGDDVARVSESVTTGLPEVIGASLAVLLTLLGLGVLDWRLALAGLLALPAYVLALRWYLPRSGRSTPGSGSPSPSAPTALLGAVQGAETIRAYARSGPHAAEVARRSAVARDVGVGVFRLYTDFGWRMNRSEYIGLAAVLARRLRAGPRRLGTVGEVTTAALLFHRLFGPLGTLLFSFDEVQAAGAALVRLVGVVDLPDPASPRSAPAGPHRPAVELRGIGHRYGDGPAGARRRRPADRAGGAGGAGRRQRRGQDHAGRRARRRAGARRRARCSSTGCPPPRCRAGACATWWPWSARRCTSSPARWPTTSGSPARTPPTTRSRPRWSWSAPAGWPRCPRGRRPSSARAAPR